MSEEKKTLRAHSRRDFVPNGSDVLREELYLGSLQRIADACELMAKRHTDLIWERDRYHKNWKDTQAERDALDRSNRALRGQITKLKRRLK